MGTVKLYKMDKIKFQYFSGNIKDINPKGFVTLNQFIEAQRNPKEDTQNLIAKIAAAKDSMEKGELKKRLFYFTPSVIVGGGRSYSNISKFTKLLVLDFDHVDNATRLRDVLYEQYSFIIASWVSPSRKGVKCLVSIPECSTVAEFKAYYWGLYQEMCIYAGLDTTGQNPVLPLFLSFDKDIRVREDYSTWEGKGTNPSEFTHSPKVVASSFKTSDRKKRNVVAIIESIISKASGNGHPTVRTASLMIGGYAGYGYLTEVEANDIMIVLINGNDYLSKKAAGYRKTAREFINKGMEKPLELT